MFTTTFVTPSTDGVTFTLKFVFICLDVSELLAAGLITSPFCSSSDDFVTSKVPSSILFVLIDSTSDSTGPFPVLSDALVFTKYSVSFTNPVNVSDDCQFDHVITSFSFVPIAYWIVDSSIPVPKSVCLNVA